MNARKFSGPDLVIATHNKGKLDEFHQMFGAQVNISCAADYGLPSPDETGQTFLDNAKLKALFVAQKTGKPALADDSGLCVDALDGAPGIYSADWAELSPGGPRDFNAAMQKVHKLLGHARDKKAFFFCCLVLAWPDGHTEFAEGRICGEIIWPPRGNKGHGYDPIFRPDGYNETYGELDQEQKNADSHRARAFRAMREKCF
jgi:XTP/dITP diphosphohydrolase